MAALLGENKGKDPVTVSSGCCSLSQGPAVLPPLLAARPCRGLSAGLAEPCRMALQVAKGGSLLGVRGQ